MKTKSLNALVQSHFSCLTSAIEKCRIKQDNIFDVLNWEDLISLVGSDEKKILDKFGSRVGESITNRRNKLCKDTDV